MDNDKGKDEWDAPDADGLQYRASGWESTPLEQLGGVRRGSGVPV